MAKVVESNAWQLRRRRNTAGTWHKLLAPVTRKEGGHLGARPIRIREHRGEVLRKTGIVTSPFCENFLIFLEKNFQFFPTECSLFCVH